MLRVVRVRKSEKRIVIDGSDHGPDCKLCDGYVCLRCRVYAHEQAVYGPSFVIECPECREWDTGRGPVIGIEEDLPPEK